MGFFDWYLNCIKGHYADFEGRARRTEYWMFFLVNLIVSIGVTLVGRAIGFHALSALYGLALLLPGLAVGVRRLHDTGRSGWWWLVTLIPLAGAVWLIVLLALPGDQGANQYGVDPKAGVA
jgi:uncharacterized membrane protein YhaH (DUF805 family)